MVVYEEERKEALKRKLIKRAWKSRLSANH
jgi:hypothetical protein